MIIAKLMGGVGNQMFQYALGRRLSLERNVPLRLDLSWFKTQSLRHYLLDTFRINACLATSADVSLFTKSYWNKILRKLHHAKEHCKPYYTRLVVDEQYYFYDPRITDKIGENALLVGYWQTEKYFKTIDSLIRYEFQLKEPFSEENKHWLEKVESQYTISVHVRRSDYISNPRANAMHGVCPIDYYIQASNILRKKYPLAIFVIFSDDLEWARNNMGFFSPALFVEMKGLRKDSEELALMSLCSHHIIANSSFSWWGAWLGVNPQKTVIFPRSWFNDPSINTKDLIPNTWLGL